MAFHDCDVEEADILEVQSVSDMFSAFKTPAADAVKLIGGDDIAVFSPQLGLMVVTSQYDLEEPATTSQTVILSLADAECTWPDPPEYIWLFGGFCGRDSGIGPAQRAKTTIWN